MDGACNTEEGGDPGHGVESSPSKFSPLTTARYRPTGSPSSLRKDGQIRTARNGLPSSRPCRSALRLSRNSQELASCTHLSERQHRH